MSSGDYENDFIQSLKDDDDKKVDFIPPISSIYSRGELNSNLLIHTFIASISKDYWSDPRIISLFSELPAEAKGKFTDIIQRNVNTDRAKTIAANFIVNPKKEIKYLPPIIVVLLPKNDDETISNKYLNTKEDGLGVSGFNTGYKAKDSWNEVYPDKASQIIQLAWDRLKFYAVVIDGQHRLTAIRESKVSSELPVVFMLFDPKVKNLNLVRCTRELFIDINNTAKSVSLGRLILMDDTNVHRVLTRDCIQQEPRIFSDLKDLDIKEFFNLNFSRETEEKRISHQSVQTNPYCLNEFLIDFTDEDESKKDSGNIVMGILNSGPVAFTNIFILYKIVKESMAKNDFYKFCKILDETNTETISNRIQTLCEEKEDITIEEIKKDTIIKPFLLNNVLRNLIFWKYNEYAATKTSESNEIIISNDNDEILFQYQADENRDIAQKLYFEVQSPVSYIFNNFLWAKNIKSSIIEVLDKIDQTNFHSKDQLKEIFYKICKQLCKQSVQISTEQTLKDYTHLSTQEKSFFSEAMDEFFEKIYAPKFFEQNILRTSVGQRAIFGIFNENTFRTRKNQSEISILSILRGSNASAHSKKFKSITKNIDIAIALSDIFEQCESKDFFWKEYSLPIQVGEKSINHFIWDGILLKKSAPDKPGSMIPHDNAAKNGSIFLLSWLDLSLPKTSLSTLRKEIGKAFASKVNHALLLNHLKELISVDFNVENLENWRKEDFLNSKKSHWAYDLIAHQSFIKFLGLHDTKKENLSITKTIQINDTGMPQFLNELIGSYVHYQIISQIKIQLI